MEVRIITLAIKPGLKFTYTEEVIYAFTGFMYHRGCLGSKTRSIHQVFLDRFGHYLLVGSCPGARSKFWGLSGSEDRGGGDNSIQFINFGRVGDKIFKE